MRRVDSPRERSLPDADVVTCSHTLEAEMEPFRDRTVQVCDALGAYLLCYVCYVRVRVPFLPLISPRVSALDFLFII